MRASIRWSAVVVLAGLLASTVAIPASADSPQSATLSGQFLFSNGSHYLSRVVVQSPYSGDIEAEVSPDEKGAWSATGLAEGHHWVKYSYLSGTSYTLPQFWNNGHFIIDPDRETAPEYSVYVGRTTVTQTVVAPAPRHAAPYGQLVPAQVSDDLVSVRGWAIDPDRPGRALRVIVEVDGVTPGTAVRAREVGSDGFAHWFTVTFPSAPGLHTVCATAMGLKRGGDTSLGCETVQIDAS